MIPGVVLPWSDLPDTLGVEGRTRVHLKETGDSSNVSPGPLVSAARVRVVPRSVTGRDPYPVSVGVSWCYPAHYLLTERRKDIESRR